MMLNTPTLTRRFERVFDRRQASVLAESITEAYDDLVKTSDFSELKGIVQELAVTQQRTEIKVEELVVTQQRTEIKVEELATAQQRTEIRVEELAVAQQRTEIKVKELAVNMSHMTQSMDKMSQSMDKMSQDMSNMSQSISGVRSEVGGLSRTMSYALENEAFRVLPAYLEKNFDIIVESRFVRTEIGGEELNFYAHGEQNGRSVCIIGESKLKIDERRHSGKEFGRIMSQLDRKAAVVQQDQPDCGIVRMLVTHYVRPSARQLLEDEGILVVQSFDWG